jgi:hypothetical protein
MNTIVIKFSLLNYLDKPYIKGYFKTLNVIILPTYLFFVLHFFLFKKNNGVYIILI